MKLERCLKILQKAGIAVKDTSDWRITCFELNIFFENVKDAMEKIRAFTLDAQGGANVKNIILNKEAVRIKPQTELKAERQLALALGNKSSKKLDRSINNVITAENTKVYKLPTKTVPKPVVETRLVLVTQAQRDYYASEAFLKSWEWKHKRIEILAKYKPQCMCCGKAPDPETKTFLCVDHIKPRRKYPELSLDENNLQILCNQCNWDKGNLDGDLDFRRPEHRRIAPDLVPWQTNQESRSILNTVLTTGAPL